MNTNTGMRAYKEAFVFGLVRGMDAYLVVKTFIVATQVARGDVPTLIDAAIAFVAVITLPSIVARAAISYRHALSLWSE